MIIRVIKYYINDAIASIKLKLLFKTIHMLADNGYDVILTPKNKSNQVA